MGGGEKQRVGSERDEGVRVADASGEEGSGHSGSQGQGERAARDNEAAKEEIHMRARKVVVGLGRDCPEKDRRCEHRQRRARHF